MHKIILSILSVVCFIGVTSAQGIKFSDNLDESLAKAKQENKLVFVDFYSTW